MIGDIKVAWRNLGRNKRRNLATGIAIGLGFAALIALGSYYNRVQNYLKYYTLYSLHVGHLNIYKKGGLDGYAVKPKRFSLGPEDQDRIKAAVDNLNRKKLKVELHGAQMLGSGLIGNGCQTFPFFGFGIDPALDRSLRMHPEMLRWRIRTRAFATGRGLWEYPGRDDALILATGLARILGKSRVLDDFGGKAPLVVVDCAGPNAKADLAQDANVQIISGSWSGMMNAIDGEVAGTYNTGVIETNNAAVVMPIKRMQALYDTDNVTFWSIWLKDGEQTTRARKVLEADLTARGAEVDIYEWADERMSPFYSGTMQFLNVLISFLGFVLLTVVVFSVFNSATMTVIERSQEIGMMRSLGYTKRGIRILYVIEVALLNGLSLLGGGLIAAIGIGSVNRAEIILEPPGVAGGLPLVFTPSVITVTGALSIVTALALVTTWFAVSFVAKRNIATLLLGTQR